MPVGQWRVDARPGHRWRGAGPKHFGHDSTDQAKLLQFTLCSHVVTNVFDHSSFLLGVGCVLWLSRGGPRLMIQFESLSCLTILRARW